MVLIPIKWCLLALRASSPSVNDVLAHSIRINVKNELHAPYLRGK